MDEEDNYTFLPKELIPKKPSYNVWYTGTLGQAEWLIAFSKKLKGNAIPFSCAKSLSNVPEQIRPLLSLEQPDLIVTDNKNNPLISIEITEQQAFGTNAQQRIARFWSSVANKIPSAYILPLESYQIEKCTNTTKIDKIMNEPNQEKKEFLLFCETLLRVKGEETYNNGITSIEELKNKIRNEDYEKIAGISENSIKQLKTFLKKFIDGDGETKHLVNIPPLEYYHKVGDTYYKAYLRKPEVTDSMLLEWFNLSSIIIPTYPFKLQSDLVNLFRTNGLTHIIDDKNNSFLSYRNLPPKPGQTKVVHKFDGNEKDEIELFFNFVDACIEKRFKSDFVRKKVMASGQYWNEDLKEKWFEEISKIEDIDRIQSGDFSCSSKDFFEFFSEVFENIDNDYIKSFENFDKLHIYKIYNTEPKRGLYDPYSGNLAVRDILFTRKLEKNTDLIRFDRTKPLVFLVDFKEKSAEEHKFISYYIDKLFEKYYSGNENKFNLQEKLIWLLKNIKLHQFTKELRCHILFSDIIFIRRHIKDKIKFELIFGVPTLIRMNLLKLTDKSIQTLRI
jgi:hypothetical protein